VIKSMALALLVLSLAFIGCVGQKPIGNQTTTVNNTNITTPPTSPPIEEVENAASSEIENELNKALENVSDEEIEKELSNVV